MLIKVRKFLTSEEYTKNPVPFRTMRVSKLERETDKAILVSLVATPLPTSECIHCGREISHPQSLHFGIGSTCIKHYPELLELVDYTQIEESYEKLKQAMSKIIWEGWLPKSSIQMIAEGSGIEIVFMYKGKQYRIVTQNGQSVDEIRQKADYIISEQEIEL